MGTQKKEITVALNIAAKINEATKNINALKSQINDIELSKSMSAEFTKEFKKIIDEVNELQRRTSSGEINIVDGKAANKEIENIEKRWNYLISKIEQNGFLDKGLKKDAAAMAALENVQKNYTQNIKNAEATEDKLVKKLEAAKTAHLDLLNTQKTQQTVSEVELKNQQTQVDLLLNQEKAAKKARNEAEKALRAKIASNPNYSVDQLSQKGSGLRKTKEFRDFNAAQIAYDNAHKKTSSAQGVLDKMITPSMQVEEAKKAQEAIDKAADALKNFQQTSLATAKIDTFENAKDAMLKMAEFKDVDWGTLGIDISQIQTIEDLENALNKLRAEAGQRTTQAMNNLAKTTTEGSKGFEELKEDISNANDSLNTFEERAKQSAAFENKIKQFLGMAGAVEVFRRALRSAFETTKQLDNAMTEMAVVTDLEIGDYWNQMPEHTKRASELGVAIHKVYEAETLYYQQGLKTEEATALANQTLKMARIAGLDAADATDKMTAALRGFNMELDEASAEKVADVYSKLAAITAADVGEISSAMTKTASIASSAGMEFETTAAFLSQIIETTRESAETAGTAMKTVIARFSEVKKLQGEGLLTGSDEEGEVIDVNKIQTALRTVGISMDEFFQGSEGLDSIFLKLAEKWDTLDKKTQRYIATTAAGSRQQSRFIAMMSDYGRTQELVSAATDSAGASQEQFNKTTESLTTKLTRLKNAWDEFSMGILESGLVKFGVDALTKFLEIINKATSAFGGMGNTIAKVLTTITLFKISQTVFNKIKQPMMNFLTEMVGEIYQKGVKGGEAYAQGTKAGMTAEVEKQKTSTAPAKKTGQTTKPKSILDKFGASTFQEVGALNAETAKEKTTLKNIGNKRALKKAVEGTQKELNEANKELQSQYVDDNLGSAAVVRQGVAELEFAAAEEKLKEYKEQEQKVQEASIKGWNKCGEALKNMGSAIAGVGVGVSMVGGILATLGLEELGDTLGTIGNVLIIVGSAFSALGTIVPIVGSIMVKTGISVQAAFWPILVITLAIAAAIAIVAGAIALFKHFESQKYENRLKDAEEAAKEAQAAAESAEAAYEELLSAKSGYDELQKQLDNLTQGTNEWKKALRESNAEVLKLLETYPELAQYVTRGEYGELEIDEAGWDKMLADQQKAVANAQSNIMSSQLNVQSLKMEKARGDWDSAVGVYRQNTKARGASRVFDAEATAALRDRLESIYLVAGETLTDEMAQIIASDLNIDITTVQEAAEALEESADEINRIAEDSENIARSYLTTLVSEDVTNSDYGEAAIDAFANSTNNEVFSKAVAEQVDKLKEGMDYKDSAEFARLADEYGISDDLTGEDTKDLQKLYAAMHGLKSIEDIPEGIAKDREEMLKAIASTDQTNKLLGAMETYLDRVEKIANEKDDPERAQNIAGLLSNEGKGMSRAFAEGFMDGDSFDRNKVNEIADELYAGGIEEWAKEVGKTTEELYDEIEGNVRDSIKINESTFGKLNKVLKKGENERVASFGKSVQLSTKNNEALAENIIHAVSVAGEEGGDELRQALDNALSSAGKDADKFADILGAMNWNSADDWKELPELLDNMGITIDSIALENFINKAKELGIAIETVNFETVTQKIKGMYDLLKAMVTGEQGRAFSEENYNKLVDSNEDLAKDFVQIGDTMYYLGGTMETLADELRTSSALEAQIAAVQLESQKKMSLALDSFEETGARSYAGETLKLENGYDKWDRSQMLAYLEQYQSYAIENGVDTFSYLTDSKTGENLGLTLGDNFNNYTDAKLQSILTALFDLDTKKLTEETAKQVADATIASYALLASDTNVEQARLARTTGDEATADAFSKALAIQATDSGMVADATIGKYNELVAKNFSELSEAEKIELSDLENSILEQLNYNAELLEDLRTLNEMSNNLSEAMYNIRQNEIDKLSAINDSINDANSAMINKIQEQIDDERQARKNEKTEKDIAKDQSKLAYLMADTSGAGMLGAQMLQQQIAEKQQDYQDSLIDQGLQKLSDDNAAAAAQRERQIAIMEAQLTHDQESGNLARAAEAIVVSSLQQINEGVSPMATELYNILVQAENIEGGMATQSQIDAFNADFQANATEAANSYEDISNISQTGTKQTTLESLDIWLKDELTRQENEKNAAITEENNKKIRESAISEGANAIRTSKTGLKGAAGSEEFQKAFKAYTEAGGDPDEFYDMVKKKAGEVTFGRIENPSAEEITISGLDDVGLIAGKYDEGISVTVGTQKFDNLEIFDPAEKINPNNEQDRQAVAPREAWNAMGEPTAGRFGVYNGVPYYARASQWWTIFDDETNKPAATLASALKIKLNQYKTGGLADFTGPAWLDGTKSKPELVLNSRDTENFIQLKDILSEIMQGTGSINNQTEKSGDNYFDININVEEIKDDYDVEQLATKIRKMIYDDASYRNVNAVSFVR